MNWRSPFRSGKALVMLGGIAALIGTLCPTSARADMYNRKTILTIKQPLQVEDTVLDPGTYVFRLADSSSNRNIVLIYNKDENRLINTVMTIPAARVTRTSGNRFTFWETPPGTARALRDWYYPGDWSGQEFRYPKTPKVIETAYANESTPSVVETPPAPLTAPVPQPAAIPPVNESVNTPPPAAESEPVEIAQNNPPPASVPATQSTPSNTTDNGAATSNNNTDNSSLPQTASPFPLIGLAGLFSLALYAFFRLGRAQ